MTIPIRACFPLFVLSCFLVSFSQAQTIANISPASGVTGDQVTITGTSLLCPNGWTRSLSFSDNIVSWTNTQIVAIVPPGLPGNATSIPVYITCTGRWEGEDAQSNTVYFTLLQALITSISPTSGWPGDQVTITGSGFGALQGTSTVTLNNVLTPVTSWSDTNVVVTVPSGAGSGQFVVNIAGLSPTTSHYFIVPPYIASVTPSSGGVGTEIRIHGEGLDLAGTEHVLYVGGTPTETSSWSDTLVTATIRVGSVLPAASTVPLFISYVGQDGYEVTASNRFDYTVLQAPVTSVVPSEATPTEEVVIHGSNFGATQQQSTVTFSGIPAQIRGWSDTEITAVVPEGVTSGHIIVSVPGLGSGWYWFVVRPWLKQTTPATAVLGTLLTITGQGLLPGGYDTQTLTVNGNAVSVESWTDSQIAFQVPEQPLGATSIEIQALYEWCDPWWEGGCLNDSSNKMTVAIQQPGALVLSGITPDSGYVGTTVTISGIGFGVSQGTSTVSFNGTIATPSSWSDSAIQVAVPSGATSGPITVTVNGASVQSTAFTVLSTTSSLLSITISPFNLTLVSGMSSQELQATGHYSNGGTSDVTSVASWTSSNAAVATVVKDSNNRAFVSPASVGSATIAATLENVSESVSVTVVPTPNPGTPVVAGVSPTSGVAGIQVTIVGSGFGSTQGIGNVLLGTTYGIVTSWSDMQIVADVSPISQSGVIQVQQNGKWSNTIGFSVSTPVVSNVSPASGLPGTQITISGSGFGDEQGSGQVWLGTTSAVVQSWSDSQIVAIVDMGALSGSARVLQNGVMSNAVPFAINLPHIDYIYPAWGPVGTEITLSGSGFGGETECGGANTTIAPEDSYVWIGESQSVVTSWCDSKIVVNMPSNAVTSQIKVYANDTWSNAQTFTVATEAPTITLVPNVMSMVVGETRTISAMDVSGQSVTGLTWSSSNTAVATLSTGDSPVITAATVGTTTISAGNALAELTVYPGPALPLGTTIWSNPGDGSGVREIVPAVPSPTGVADVFALTGNCNLQAMTGDGKVAWTINIGQPWLYSNKKTPCNKFLPDFQGGVIVLGEKHWTDGAGNPYTRNYVQKVDGLTGQTLPVDLDLLPSIWWRDLNYWPNGFDNPWIATWPDVVVHPDGTVFALSSNLIITDPGFPENGAVIVTDPQTAQHKAVIDRDPSGLTLDAFGDLIIAGDGYAYVPYVASNITKDMPCNSSYQKYFNLLRIDTNGNASSIPLQSWNLSPLAGCLNGQSVSIKAAHVITDADRGVLASWQADTYTGTTRISTTNYIATTSGTSVVAQATTPRLLKPVLQAQDGSFFGTSQDSEGIISFEASGKERWSVPGDSPKVATADGGVIGVSGSTYDNQGRATGQIANLPTYSWSGERYVSMSNNIANLTLPSVSWATGYATMTEGNLSQNGAAIGVNTANEFSIPVFVLPSLWGTTCWLGNGKIPLIGDALQHYLQKKQALLDGEYLTSASCSAFFHATPQRAAYFDHLTDAVTRQVPYDGKESILSQYDAGMWTSWADNNDTSMKKKMPVCALFRDWKGAHGKQHVHPANAAAQLQSPGTDAYINSAALNYVTQGTVLHEALHNLTGLFDYKVNEDDTHDGLEELFSLDPNSGSCANGRTMCITEKLVEVGCAGTD